MGVVASSSGGDFLAGDVPGQHHKPMADRRTDKER
jgi:hypothetical protein